MKKIDDQRQLWLERVQKERENNRIHHNEVARAKRRGVKVKASIYFGSDRIRSGWLGARGREMPAKFCLDENYTEVVVFLDETRRRLHERYKEWLGKKRTAGIRRKVQSWIDISTIEKITPSAALILTSEFDRIRRLSGQKSFAIDVHKWKPGVASVFQQLGLFQILEIDPESVRRFDEHPHLYVMPMRSGMEVSGELADIREELALVAIQVASSAKSINKEIIDSDEAKLTEEWIRKAQGIYSILVEAMDNVINHAYPDNIENEYKVVKRWWMTAAVDKEQAKLNIIIFDQGVSIPVSLPNWSSYGRLKRILQRLLGADHDVADRSHDGHAIRLATRVAASSTKQAFRGKGLAFMADFLQQCRDGRLRIISRCGEYTLTKSGVYSVTSHQVSIGGTLIEWEVHL